MVRALAFHLRGCGFDSQRELSQCYSDPVLHSCEKSQSTLCRKFTQCSTHVKKVSQHSAESRGFSPGTPVSSHREVDRVG